MYPAKKNILRGIVNLKSIVKIRNILVKIKKGLSLQALKKNRSR
jgi:hypothetical protein